MSNRIKTLGLMVAALSLCTLVTSCGGDSGAKKAPTKKAATGGGDAAKSNDAPSAAAFGPAGGVPNLGSTATIKGVFKFEGQAPTMQKLDLSKDSWCKQNHEVFQETLVVDAQGGVRDVVAYIKELDKHGKAFPAPSGAAKIQQKGCKYTPHVFTARVGQPVEMVNADQVGHNYHFTGERNDEINNNQPKPGTDNLMFKKPETLAQFNCDMHPWMNARVFVFEHPCFAVSSETGEFTITGVPAGKYHVVISHETAKAAQTEIEVTVGGGETKDLGIIKLMK